MSSLWIFACNKICTLREKDLHPATGDRADLTFQSAFARKFCCSLWNVAFNKIRLYRSALSAAYPVPCCGIASTYCTFRNFIRFIWNINAPPSQFSDSKFLAQPCESYNRDLAAASSSPPWCTHPFGIGTTATGDEKKYRDGRTVS